MSAGVSGMATGLLKRALGWNRRGEAEKRAVHRRIAVARYRLRAAVATLLCWVPIPLATLLRRAGSDKHQPDGHLYGHAYARAFARFRYRRVKLLEIGIGGYDFSLGGQSLTAWQAYFPRGRIVACDIEDKPGLATAGTRIYRVDQSSEADLAMLREREGPFDIIIDDGSHLSRHQIFTFHRMFDALRDGGVYVIEDVMTSFWRFGGWDGAPIDSPDFAATCVGHFLGLTRYLNADEFESADGVDPALARLAANIGAIWFEKNLILIERREGPKGETAIHRIRAALARKAAGGPGSG